MGIQMTMAEWKKAINDRKSIKAEPEKKNPANTDANSKKKISRDDL